ncbi:MAG: hypothetical protein P0120_16710 [Nitrospira sp.]|nr:hypothetical protein [Nitrospira sp.]
MREVTNRAPNAYAPAHRPDRREGLQIIAAALHIASDAGHRIDRRIAPGAPAG